MSRIAYDRTTIFGKITAETVNSLLNSTATLFRLKNSMDAALGSPAVWANLEGGDFGVSSGNGEAFYNTVISLWSSMNAIAPATISSVDMGG